MELNGNSIISNVAWKFAERILAQVVSLVVSIVLARVLLPDDYGAVTMVMIFINIANVFVTQGIPSALIQKKDADHLDFSSVFYFNLVFSGLLYALIFFSAPFIAEFYDDPLLKPVFRVLGLRIIVAAVNSVQHSYVARHMIFKKYFWSTLFGTLLSGVIGIVMAYKGFGVWALVAQYMSNTIVDTIVLLITVNWRPKIEFDFSRVRKLAKFGWKMLFESLSATISGEIRNLIIGKVYTKSDLAYYSKGQQFPSLIISNVTSSIGSVLFPAMSNEQNNPERVLQILRKSVKLSSYVVFPLLVGLGVVAKPLILLLLTDKWADTIIFLQCFCVLNIPVVGMNARHQALTGIGRSDVFMNEHIISRTVSLIILLLTYKISVMAIVASSFASTFILSFIVAFTSKRYNGYTYKDQVLDIIPTVFGCIIMGVPVYLLNYLSLPNMLLLILQVMLGIVIYIGYSMLVKLESFYLCKDYMKLVLNKLLSRRA